MQGTTSAFHFQPTTPPPYLLKLLQIKPGRTVLLIKSSHTLQNQSAATSIECTWKSIGSQEALNVQLGPNQSISFARPVIRIDPNSTSAPKASTGISGLFSSMTKSTVANSPSNQRPAFTIQIDKSKEVIFDDGQLPSLDPTPTSSLTVVGSSLGFSSSWFQHQIIDITESSTTTPSTPNITTIFSCKASIYDLLRLSNSTTFPLEFTFQSAADDTASIASPSYLPPMGLVKPNESISLNIPPAVTSYIQLLVRLAKLPTTPSAHSLNSSALIGSDWSTPPLLLAKDKPVNSHSTHYIRFEGDQHQIPLQISTLALSTRNNNNNNNNTSTTSPQTKSTQQQALLNIEVLSAIELTNETNNEMFIVTGETDVTAFGRKSLDSLRHSPGVAWLPSNSSKPFYWKFSDLNRPSISIGLNSSIAANSTPIIPSPSKQSVGTPSPVIVWSMPFSIDKQVESEIVFKLRTGSYARFHAKIRRSEYEAPNGQVIPLMHLIIKPRFVLINRTSSTLLVASPHHTDSVITPVPGGGNHSALIDWPLISQGNISSSVRFSLSEWYEKSCYMQNSNLFISFQPFFFSPYFTGKSGVICLICHLLASEPNFT